MDQRPIPAVFMRGGTSKGLMFHQRDLPADTAEWTSIFCGAMGTPDDHGRQLNGMGGGISSLSKVCILAAPSREDADVDFTFAQVMVREARVDYRSNCGNMSAAVGPFAFDEGLVTSSHETCRVRIHNTNTGKMIHSTFEVEGARSRYDGEFSIPGVGASGSPIRLDFLDPGGATTGKLLPSGHVSDWLDVPGHGPVEVSLVDAANATVFVRARDVGLTGSESPAQLEVREDALDLLESIRREASVRMGITADVESAALTSSVPFVCVVSEAAARATLSGTVIAASDAHLLARVISNGQPHRALPLTISLCTAVAARLRGSVVERTILEPVTHTLRLAMPSGVLSVDAQVDDDEGAWVARSGTFYRTARRLFDGRVWIPG